MIKADKVTRISPVTLVKNALNAYVNLNESNILFSNTNILKLKEETPNQYLKDINYFVDEFNTTKEIQIEIGLEVEDIFYIKRNQIQISNSLVLKFIIHLLNNY